MTEMLSAEEAVACADDCYPDDGTMVTASVLRLLRSHEALRRRLAEVEAIADEMADGVSPECSGFADKIRAVLDKGERR